MKYIIYLFSLVCFASSFTNNIHFKNKLLKNNKKRSLHLVYVNSTISDKKDLIEEYSEWFGLFPKEKKWKNVRFTFYSIFAGYIFAEGFQNIKEYLSTKELIDYFQ